MATTNLLYKRVKTLLADILPITLYDNLYMTNKITVNSLFLHACLYYLIHKPQRHI